MSYIKKWNDAVNDLAEQIAPEIAEQIQETIAWKTDKYDFADHLKGDDYLQFAEEIKIEVIKTLSKIH